MSGGINKPARALSTPCRAGFADLGCALRALAADSEEIVRAIRDDVAQGCEMIPPGVDCRSRVPWQPLYLNAFSGLTDAPVFKRSPQ